MDDAIPSAIDWSKLTADDTAELARRLFGPPEIKGGEVRRPLRTPEEAWAYAERVAEATQQASLDYYAQRPFVVEDRGDTWFVIASGTRSPLFAPLHIALRKADAAVVSYGMTLKDGRVAPDASVGSR